jgi:hypothetical protein
MPMNSAAASAAAASGAALALADGLAGLASTAVSLIVFRRAAGAAL